MGTRVIQASKESTINSLRDLGPVLEGFAKAGQNFPKAFQVFLTYPFVDEAVGRDPQVARNLHMGDYTNLSIDLNIDVANLPTLPTGPVCDAIAVLRERANQAADQIVTPQTFPTPPFTEDDRNNIREQIVGELVAQFEEQCRAPNVQDLVRAVTDEMLDAVLELLGLDDLPRPRPRWHRRRHPRWSHRGTDRQPSGRSGAAAVRPRQRVQVAAAHRPVRPRPSGHRPGHRHVAPPGGG